MRFREKLLILLIAVLVSVLGFYLISSPFVGLHMMARKTGNEKIERYLAECDDNLTRSRHITGKPFQITHVSPSDNISRTRRTIKESK